MKAINIKEIKNKFTIQSEKYQELRKQRGMTLLEVIIVLGIIGTIAAGVVTLAQRAFDNKAISDVVSNVNIVRASMKEAYGLTGVYPPADVTNTQSLTEADIVTRTPDTQPPIGKLYLLGKISITEAKNNISGNFFNTGGANFGTAVNGVNRGYFVMINGLTQKQCRNILLQTGSDWDYVEVASGMETGTYVNRVIDLAAALTNLTAATFDATTGTTTPAVITASTGIYRSMVAGGRTPFSADTVLGACNDDSANGIILGSR